MSFITHILSESGEQQIWRWGDLPLPKLLFWDAGTQTPTKNTLNQLQSKFNFLSFPLFFFFWRTVVWRFLPKNSGQIISQLLCSSLLYKYSCCPNPVLSTRCQFHCLAYLYIPFIAHFVAHVYALLAWSCFAHYSVQSITNIHGTRLCGRWVCITSNTLCLQRIWLIQREDHASLVGSNWGSYFTLRSCIWLQISTRFNCRSAVSSPG